MPRTKTKSKKATKAKLKKTPTPVRPSKSAKRKSKKLKIKLEARPLTEQQIAEFVAYYKVHKAFPGSKIPCSVTGKLTTCMGPWMVKKIEEYGGPEQLLRNYKCRGAMKSERAAKKPVVIRRRRMKKERKHIDVANLAPKFENSGPKKMSLEELIEETRTVCMRPAIYLDNGRHCADCPYYEICENRLKCLPKNIYFENGQFVESIKKGKR